MALTASIATPYLTDGVTTVFFGNDPNGSVSTKVWIRDYEEVFSTNQARIKIPYQEGEILDPGSANARIIRMTLSIQTTNMADFESYFADLETLARSTSELQFYYYYGATAADRRYLDGCYILGEIPKKRSDFMRFIPAEWPTFSLTIIATDPVWYTPGGSTSLGDLVLAAGRNLIVRGNIYQYDGPSPTGNLTRVLANTGLYKATGGIIQGLNAPITWP